MLRTHRRLAAALAALTLVLVLPSAAGATQPARGVKRVNQITVNAVSQSNLFEIRSSQVALQRSKNTAVRDLARMFIADHTAQQAQVATAGRALGLRVPTRLNAAKRAIVNSLRRVPAAQFDVAWLRAQRRAHRQTIVLVASTALNTRVATSLRLLAATAFPVVERHLIEVESLLASR